MHGNLLIGQSGGPTAVINASLAGVLAEAGRHAEVSQVLGALNGLEGWLEERIVDLTGTKASKLDELRRTPAAALGSCRRKLGSEDSDKLFDVLAKYGVRYLLYAGGNDSMDTCHRIWTAARHRRYDLRVVGIPKTVDNDLAETDHCPGYGSAARYIALSTRDTGLDQQSLRSFVPILITEVFGRHAGWLAAAASLAKEKAEDAPHLVYVPERVFNESDFLTDVEQCYRRLGWVSVVVSEGVADVSGELLGGKDAPEDAFGHKALPLGSGVAQYLARLLNRETGLLVRVNRPGTIQRASSCAVSEVDRNEAEEVGRAAVRQAVSGEDGCMITLIRDPEDPYRCTTGYTPLQRVANAEKKLPEIMIESSGNAMRPEFRDYAFPLIGSGLARRTGLTWPPASPCQASST
jgi:6-phosphofructokinase